MKKIILLISILFACYLPSFAQGTTRTGTLLTYNGSGVARTHDTLTNTDTAYMWNGRNDHNQWNVSDQFVVTQLTGTVTPSIIVQGSNDATAITAGHWYTLVNDKTQNVSAVDTGTARNTYYMFALPFCQFKYLRIRVIMSGTGTSIPSGIFCLSAPYGVNLN